MSCYHEEAITHQVLCLTRFFLFHFLLVYSRCQTSKTNKKWHLLCDTNFHFVLDLCIRLFSLCANRTHGQPSRGNKHNFLLDCVATNAQRKHVVNAIVHIFGIWNPKPKINEEKCNEGEIRSQRWKMKQRIDPKTNRCSLKQHPII